MNAKEISDATLESVTPANDDLMLIYDTSAGTTGKATIASIAPIIQANFDISNGVASGDTRPVESDAVYTALENVDAVKYVSTLPIGTDIKNLIYGVPKTSGNFEFYVGNTETQLTYALSRGEANFEDITSQIEILSYIKPYTTLKVLKMGKFVVGNLYAEKGAPVFLYIPVRGMTFLTGLPKPIGAFFKVDSEMMYDRDDNLLFDDLQLYVTANDDTGILKAIRGQALYHKLSISFSYISQ